MRTLVTIVAVLLVVAATAQSIQITATGKRPTTIGSATGAWTVEVSNGVPPYTYQWSNGATTLNISGLTAGEYTLTVTDATAQHAIGSGLLISDPPACTGIYCDTKNGVLYDFTTDKLTVPVKAGTLTPLPADLKGLAKATLKGQTSASVVMPYVNALTRWIMLNRK